MEYPRICPTRWLSDQDFGMCMPHHGFLYPFYDMNSSYFRPWKWYNQCISKEFGSTVENEKGNYKITLDVQHFHPNDISVKVVDNEIIVEGRHEDRPDTHGFISRQFKRRYALPSHCPAENVTSTMSSDGVLTIIAAKTSSSDLEKIVPIKICGKCPRKTHIESKLTSETIQKSLNDNIKENNGDLTSKSNTQITFKEDHSRLLKPELLKDKISDTNGEKMAQKVASKQVADIMGMTRKKDATNVEATSKKIEDSLPKTSLASTSDMCGMKGMSKTLIEESSSSSFKSSSSMSSTIRASGKIGELSDISAELKEAAENV